MTENETGWGHPPDPEVAQHGEQPRDGLAGQPRTGELDLDADSQAVQDRLAASRTYLIAASCLAGGLVSVGLAVTEWAEHLDHDGVGGLAILGMVIGVVAGLTATVSLEKPLGWADRIKIVAAGLAFIGLFSLFFLYDGWHHGAPWVGGGQ
jgi:hypothetical protein